MEGVDNVPAHIRAARNAALPSIPVANGGLVFGTRQRTYLFEHRRQPQQRRAVAHLGG